MASAFFTKPAEPDSDLTAGWESYPGHKGLDYGWRLADPDRTRRVYAAYEGTVVSVYAGGGYNEGWGNRIIIEHAPGVRTTYSHLATGTILVAQGQRVGTGQHIATMGDTGRVTGIHLHWELYIDGVRVDPRPYREGLPIPRVEVNALQPQQRQVRSGAQARRRVGAPSTSAPSGDPVLEANTVGNFVGWVTGEKVDGNDLWYVGTSGDYFWSGAFTEVSKHDLKDMNAAPIAGNQRQVLRSAPANQRAEASKSSPTVTQLAPSTIATFDGWKSGDIIDGNGVWFREASSKLFSWSGGFTDTGTHDLADLNPKASTRKVGNAATNVRSGLYTSESIVSTLAPGAEVPVSQYAIGEKVSGIDVWYVVPGGWAWAGGFTTQSTDGLTKINAPSPSGGSIDPVYKTFKRDSELATWIGSPNYNWREPRPAGAAPTHVTMHWMDGTLAGTDAQFQKYTEVKNGVGNGSSANYGIGQTAIHQYVREQDYQQADGNQDSNRWGLSIEHEGSAAQPVTQAVMDLSAALLVDIAKRWGWTEYRLGDDAMTFAEVTQFAAANPTVRLVFPHKKWVATSCPGTLDYPAIVAAANKLLQPPAPGPDPTPEGVTITREFASEMASSARAVQAHHEGLAYEAERQAEMWDGLLG